jgi:hypothetical protein
MKIKQRLFFVILLAVFSGCEIFDNNQSIKETFSWKEVTTIPGNDVTYSFQISENAILIGTESGIYQYDLVLDTAEIFLNDTILEEMGYVIRFSEGSAIFRKAKVFNDKLYLYIADGNLIVRDSNNNILLEVQEGGMSRTFYEVLNLTRRFFDFWITAEGDVMIGSEFGTFMKSADSDIVLRNRFLEYNNVALFTNVNAVSAVYVSPSGWSLAGTSNGIYSSFNFGQDWEDIENLFPSTNARVRFITEGDNEGEIWAIGGRALMTSINDGETWEMYFGIADHSDLMFIQQNEGKILYNSNRRIKGAIRGLVTYDIQTQEYVEYLGPQHVVHQFGVINNNHLWASGPDGLFIGSPINK